MNERIDKRPDPDALLVRVQQEMTRSKHGRLKIFFGAAPGVGKTYAMLQAAQARRGEGVDVVIGYVEAHDRPETTALLRGLEILPARTTSRAGATRCEFDLAAALHRKPSLILVDELAHTNAPDSTHPKRYMDVLDLLSAGIDVYTTVNVQHLESLSDVVTQITGAPVRETIPDRLIEAADEVTLIDLSAEDLLQRLREGKVYVPDQAHHAINNFFRKGNLMALRELALRATADRVDTDIQDYRETHAIGKTWPVQERVLVCVGPGIAGERLVRAAKRAASRLKADCIALYVETADRLRLPAREREDVLRTLRLAEQLGAETITISAGRTFAEEVLELAHSRNVTRIMVGKPRRHGWQRWLLGSIVDALVEGSGNIDVLVVGDEGLTDLTSSEPKNTSRYDLDVQDETSSPQKPRARGYVASLLIVAACIGLTSLMSVWFAPTNLAMVFLLGVVLTATFFGRGPSVVAALVSVAAFDFFFVPPVYSFQFGDSQYLLSAVVLLIVGLLVSSLAAGLRLQARVATHRERRTAALYRMTREMAIASDMQTIGSRAVHHVAEVFDAQANVLTRSDGDRLVTFADDKTTAAFTTPDQSIAQWVLAQGQTAGLATDTLSAADAIYLPLNGAHSTVGVLAVKPAHRRRFIVPEQLHLLEAFATQIALAIERERLSAIARQSALSAQEERLRSSLLSSISHDLRTPLAVITGTASSLLQGESQLPAGDQRMLVESLYSEAQHINHVITNLLDITRLEADNIRLNRQWHLLEELVGAALDRLAPQLAGHPVSVEIPADLPMIRVDDVLFEKLLVNLLENAAKYTPSQTRIVISAQHREHEIQISVADNGPGFPAGSEQKLFEKFFRASSEGSIPGAGLGLAICRSIAQAHGGNIRAINSPNGGATFTITLPFEEPPADERPAHSS